MPLPHCLNRLLEEDENSVKIIVLFDITPAVTYLLILLLMTCLVCLGEYFSQLLPLKKKKMVKMGFRKRKYTIMLLSWLKKKLMTSRSVLGLFLLHGIIFAVMYQHLKEKGDGALILCNITQGVSKFIMSLRHPVYGH